MKIKSLLAAAAFALSSLSMVVYAPAASAQDATQALQSLDPATAAALQNALAAGDALQVQLVVASVQGNAAATAAVATIVLAAAQSIRAADPAGAGVLAAIAFASGGLTGTAAATAANIVNVSGSAIATTIITLSQNGAPASVLASVLIGVTTNPVQIAQNGANVVNTNDSTRVLAGGTPASCANNNTCSCPATAPTRIGSTCCPLGSTAVNAQGQCTGSSIQ